MPVNMRTGVRSSPRSNLGPVGPIQRAGQLVVLLKVALTLYVLDPAASDSFALAKSVVSHVVAFVLAGLLCVLLVRHGRRWIVFTPIHAAVLGLLIAYAAATAFAIDPTVAGFGFPRRYLGLDQLVDDAVLFVGVAALFRTARDRALLGVGAVASAVPIVIYGFVQMSGHDIVKYVAITGTVPIGTFGQPDIAGAYFGMLATIFLALALALAVWPRALHASARLALAAFAVLTAALAMATGSRGAYLAEAGGLGSLAVIFVLARFRPTVTRRAAILGPVVVAAAGAVALLGLAPALSPLFGPTAEQRLSIWQTAMRIVAAHPLLGVGPDNFGAAYPAAHDLGSVARLLGETQTSTHNVFLHVATSSGVLGLVAYGAMIVLTAAYAIRAAATREPSALVLVLLGAYVGQGVVTVTDISTQWIPFALAGIAAAGWTPGAADRPLEARRSPATVSTVAVVALLIVVFVGQAQFGRLRASEADATAVALRALQRPLAAVQPAREALRLEGSRGEYWAAFGAALSEAGNPSAARSAFEEAAARQPWNPLYWRSVAVTYLITGDEPNALKNLQRAVIADPFDAASHDLMARLAYGKGDWQRAFDEGAMATQIVPTDDQLYDAPVQASLQLRQPARAEAMLVSGITLHETAHLRVLLGRVYLALGRRSEAVAEVDRALLIAPGDPDATALRRAIGQ